MKLLQRGFFVRFGVLLVIALVPLLLYVVLMPAAGSELRGVAERTADEYDRLLNLRRQQVFTLAAFPSIRAFTASTPETRAQRAAVALDELQAWTAADKNVREAFIVDPNGSVIMSTLDNWNEDMQARPFIQQALQGQIAVSPVAKDDAEFSMYYAAPVLNNKQGIAGALVARVAAQELWAVAPHDDTWYTVLSDENAVRLDDSGDAARRMASFGGMDATRATAVLKEQQYGAELPQLRATNFDHAQQLLTQGALDQLQPADVGAGELAAQRLKTLPWSVLVVSAQLPVQGMLAGLVIPLAAALLLALGGAFLMGRL